MDRASQTRTSSDNHHIPFLQTGTLDKTLEKKYYMYKQIVYGWGLLVYIYLEGEGKQIKGMRHSSLEIVW